MLRKLFLVKYARMHSFHSKSRFLVKRLLYALKRLYRALLRSESCFHALRDPSVFFHSEQVLFRELCGKLVSDVLIQLNMTSMMKMSDILENMKIHA